jgi:hypothetical protein
MEFYSAVAYNRALAYDDMRFAEEQLAEDAGVVLEPHVSSTLMR